MFFELVEEIAQRVRSERHEGEELKDCVERMVNSYVEGTDDMDHYIQSYNDERHMAVREFFDEYGYYPSDGYDTLVFLLDREVLRRVE